MVGELALGRKTGQGVVTAYKVLSKKFRWVGWLGSLSPFFILFFYCALGGYCLKYTVLNVGNLFNASFGSNGLSGSEVFDAFMANPTEAVIYGLIVGIFIYREIKIKDLWKMFVDSAISSATVMYIVACAAVFAWLLTTSHIASDMSAGLLAVSSNKYVILALTNIIFLIAGCFLDANSAFYILIPIMLPVMNAIGVDPIHFGVFVTVNMAIGLITPPVGINLYVGCNIADLPVAELCKKIIPFLVAGIVALIVITYIPAITMVLPNMVD